MIVYLIDFRLDFKMVSPSILKIKFFDEVIYDLGW